MNASKRATAAACIAALALGTGAAYAADNATAPEAEAMVKKGIAFIKASGKQKAYAEFTNKQGQFTDRDL